MNIRHFSRLWLYLFILLFCFVKLSASESYPNRISLAISGGASMGAYEAGLIWSLTKVIQQVEQTGDWALGGELRPVEIASIAGTSAGGINSLLSALASSVNPEKEGGFANHIDDNIFRDVWLTPDVNRLLPPQADSPLYQPDDALLSRMDLIEAARKVQKKWNRPGSFRPGLRVPMGLTVTRVKPETMTVSDIAVENQRLYIPIELRTRSDGSAYFFFNPADYPSLNDPAMILMPWTADREPFTVSDKQVIDTLLTTSAFPVGFGRKRLQYCRQQVSTYDRNTATPNVPDAADAPTDKPVCPRGFELAEAEFSDGGLFDNLPIGLARLLAEYGKQYRNKPLAVTYLYLDPNRIRFDRPAIQDKTACEGDDPPEACREMTFDLASEFAVLGGAVGTARRYELYRELTGDNWRLNLFYLSQEVANILESANRDTPCDSLLPFFDQQLTCSQKLRHAGRLLDLTGTYRVVPIQFPLSDRALIRERIATTCRPASSGIDLGFESECMINERALRKQLAGALTAVTSDRLPDNDNLRNDIRRSAVSIDSDRSIHITTRGGPITGELLSAFGAFIDYKFREYDYFVGVYDAVTTISSFQCEQYFPGRGQYTQRLNCLDKLSQEIYQMLGVADNPGSRYVFALMAKQEFGPKRIMRFAYEPMPPENRDNRIIYEGLYISLLTQNTNKAGSAGVISTERGFFEHLKSAGFQPTPPPEGGKSLLALIMEDPEFWSHELVKRTTDRLVYLEQQAEDIYEAREPDPEKRESANTSVMGAGALVLRTTTYKYPTFAFAPSTAPKGWIWRNLIPYELSFDIGDGDVLVFWQPTLNFKHTNVGLRLGLGFTGGIFRSSSDEERSNFGTIGLDLTRNTSASIFSGYGITPAVYHNWSEPLTVDQTTFGLDLHVYLLKNRLRVSLGARDVADRFEDTIFLTVGVADLPGLFYWLSR